MLGQDAQILEALEEAGLVDAAAGEDLLAAASAESISLWRWITSSSNLDEMAVTQAVAQKLGLPFVNLASEPVDQALLDELSPEIIRRFRFFPLHRVNSVVTVVISDPFNLEDIDGIRYALGTEINTVLAAPSSVNALIDQHCADKEAEDEILETLQGGARDKNSETQAIQFGDVDVSGDDAPIIRLVSLIIVEAFRSRASDIHIEPMASRLRIRYRIDGVLHEVESPPKRLQAAIISRLKIMANLKIAEKRQTQDGRIQINVEGRDLDLRVSVVPSTHGESIVMRILDKEGLSLGLPQLGFLSDDQQTFKRLIHLADGIILVTGPTGSGKTTTLYSCLNEINTQDRKIITVEDPVEYQMAGINQVQVRPDIGLTFSSALRSILRQAPNIVMIGEIRDHETADIAVNASLTGHLVFSTLHTNDAPGAITRLIDIGVKPFLVASSVRAIMAQRLVRKICSECATQRDPSDQEKQLLLSMGVEVEGSKLSQGRGCPACSGTGYRGRMGIFEVFEINDEVQRLIYNRAPLGELRQRARELGMRTLREDGMRKVLAGKTTLEEVMRVTMRDES